jgi:hypothetical protein
VVVKSLFSSRLGFSMFCRKPDKLRDGGGCVLSVVRVIVSCFLHNRERLGLLLRRGEVAIGVKIKEKYIRGRNMTTTYNPFAQLCCSLLLRLFIL